MYINYYIFLRTSYTFVKLYFSGTQEKVTAGPENANFYFITSYLSKTEEDSDVWPTLPYNGSSISC